MKGILLAGGLGTRLNPITLGISKQLIPIADKPMIFYPLSVLMKAFIKDILIITTPEDSKNYKRLLGDGSEYGVRLSYIEQPEPDGIASAFILGEEFIKKDNVCLILGDNLFYGYDFSEQLKKVSKNKHKGSKIFSYQVSNPTNFGVVESDKNGKVISIEEKPEKPKSNDAVIGLYFYDNSVIEIARNLKPSARGEKEITDINQVYMKKNNLEVVKLGSGFAWLDTGTPESLLEASMFVNTLEKRQGIKVGCLEEIAYENHWLSKKEIKKNLANKPQSSYYNYIRSIISSKK